MLRRVLVATLIGGTGLLSLGAQAGFTTDKLGDPMVSLSSAITGSFDPVYYGGTVIDPDKIFGWSGANIYYDDNNNGPYHFQWDFIGSESKRDNAFFGRVSGNFNGRNFGTNPLGGPNLVFAEKNDMIFAEGDGVVDGV